METNYSRIPYIEIVIRILEFVSKRAGTKVPENQIYNHLSSDFNKESIKNAIDGLIELNRVDRIGINHYNNPEKRYLKCLNNIDNYISNLKRMIKKEKLHRILEFICKEYEKKRKTAFDSEELTQAFTPPLGVYEISSLCRILIERKSVIGNERLNGFGVIFDPRRTKEAFYTEEYLKDNGLINIPFNQNISGDNVFVGNNYGDVKQEDNISKSSKKDKKGRLLKRLYLIVGILVGITAIIVFIMKYLLK